MGFRRQNCKIGASMIGIGCGGTSLNVFIGAISGIIAHGPDLYNRV